MPSLAEYQSAVADDGKGIRWFLAENEADAALTVSAIIAKLEQQGAARRRRWLKASYMINGVEVPQTFAYSMRAPFGGAGAPIDVGVYEEPYFNIPAQGVDVLGNRIGKNRPWPIFLPNGGDYRTRTRCRKLTKYMDALFSEMGVYRELPMCFKDAMTYGISFLKVYERPGKEIGIARRLCDEIFIDANEVRGARQPKNLYERVWVHIEDAFALFPDKDDKAAIERAPRATSGVLYSSNQSEHVALCEAYHLPSRNSAGELIGGKRVLCVGDRVLDQGKHNVERFPYAVLRYDPSTTSFYGKSVYDQTVTVQKEVNATVTVIREALRRYAFPRYVSHTNDGTTEKDYANLVASVIKFKGAVPPQFVSPVTMQGEVYQWVKDSIARGFQRLGISEQSAGGIKQPGLEAGVALRTWNQIEDARHVQLGQAVEDFVCDTAIRGLDVAKVVKPVVRIPGYRDLQVKWSDVEMPEEQFISKVFPISSLPQLPEGRLATIDDWYKNGQITRTQKMRLEGMPDLEAFTGLSTASSDWIDWALDTMIDTGEYQPPDYNCKLDGEDGAIAVAQARCLHEETLGLPDDRLDLIRSFIDQAKDMKTTLQGDTAAQPPAAQPGAPAPGAVPAQSDGVQQGQAA